jgi:hypothetical protein
VVAVDHLVVKLQVDLAVEDNQFIVNQDMQEIHLQQFPLKGIQEVKVDRLTLVEEAAEAAEKAARADKELQVQEKQIVLQDHP